MNAPEQQDRKTLVVGIGSPHGDDRAGWLVVEQLRATDQHHFETQIAKSPVDLLDWLDGVERLVICDACHGLGEIGQSHRWTWPAPEIETIAMSGTHNLALPTVLALAEKLGRLPDEVVIWAIEGAHRRASTEVSTAMLQAIPQLAHAIISEQDSSKHAEEPTTQPSSPLPTNSDEQSNHRVQMSSEFVGRGAGGEGKHA